MKHLFTVALLAGAMFSGLRSANAQDAHPGRAVVLSKCFQCHTDAMFRDQRQDRRAWEATIYRMVGRGGLWTPQEIRLMADYLGAELRADRQVDTHRHSRLIRAASRSDNGRERCESLWPNICRIRFRAARFVNGLTKARPHRHGGSLRVLVSTTPEARAQATTTPVPYMPSTGARRAAAAPPRNRRRQAVPGHGRRRLRRAAHRLRREIRVRQFGERGRAVLRGLGRSAAAQIHPHAA